MKIEITTFKIEEVELEFPFYLKSKYSYVKGISDSKFLVIYDDLMHQFPHLPKGEYQLCTHEEFKQALDSTILKLSQE